MILFRLHAIRDGTFLGESRTNFNVASAPGMDGCINPVHMDLFDFILKVKSGAKGLGSLVSLALTRGDAAFQKRFGEYTTTQPRP